MSTATTKAAPLDTTFSAEIVKSPNHGSWTYVMWPESVAFFGTGGLVKVAGTMDDEPFRSSFMALGNGTHKLPVKGSVLERIGKGVGDSITVKLTGRLS